MASSARAGAVFVVVHVFAAAARMSATPCGLSGYKTASLTDTRLNNQWGTSYIAAPVHHGSFLGGINEEKLCTAKVHRGPLNMS